MLAVHSIASAHSQPAASAAIIAPCRLPDPLLLPYLQACDETRARAALDRLIHDVAAPIIEAAIRRHTFGSFATASGIPRGEGDGKDLHAETIRLLLTRVATIRQVRTSPSAIFARMSK